MKEVVHFIPPQQRKIALQAAQSDPAPVLILGGSGSGKETLGRWIHRQSARSLGPLYHVGPEEQDQLISTLKVAQTGTVIIVEIGNWTLTEQQKILGFLKTGAISLDDGTQMICGTRIIATSNQSLKGRALGGLFNSELFELLKAYLIEMPDLSTRKWEFRDIALGILQEITQEIHKEHIRDFSAGAWEVLLAYDWPGNLRELRNVLRVSVSRAKGPLLEVSDFPDFRTSSIDFHATRENFERIYLTELLKTFDWNVEKTCKAARFDKEALLSKIQKYGIQLSPLSSEMGGG